jgi:hypothetical protein
MTEKRVRGPRKKSPRGKGVRTISAASEALRKKWQDPEYRERMRLVHLKNAEGRRTNPEKYTRLGVPDGMRKKDVAPLWEQANKLADRFIQIMKDKGELPDEIVEVIVRDDDGNETDRVPVAVPTNDAGKAEVALREAFVLAVGPSTQQIKIQAINTVLNFTKSKPESKSKLTLSKAEDFLDEIMRDDGAN